MEMAEMNTIFTSKIKYKGVFSFKEFYNFCYQWLTDDIGLDVMENKYSEKIVGEAKNIEVKWHGERKMTDYFRFDVEVEFKIDGLKKVEIVQNGTKVESNTG